MAVVKPLYMSNGKPTPMSTTMVDNIVDLCPYLYRTGYDIGFGADSPVSYPKAYSSNTSPGSWASNFPTLPDTAQVSGGGWVHAHSMQDQAATISAAGDVTARGDINWQRVVVREPTVDEIWRTNVGITPLTDDPTTNVNVAGEGVLPTNDDGLYFPLVYNDDGDLQVMSKQDFLDTFIHPAVDKLVTAGTTGLPATAAGTFIVTNSSSPPTNFVNKDAHKIFQDTCADTSQYSDASIVMGGGGSPAPSNSTPGAAQTNTKDVTGGSYYLHMRDGADNDIQPPVFWDNNNNALRHKFTMTEFKMLLKRWISHTTGASTDGYRLAYALLPNDSTWPGGTNGSEVNRGIIYNKIFLGATYETDGDGEADRYASQMWPGGSLAQDPASGHGPFTLWLRKQ